MNNLMLKETHYYRKSKHVFYEGGICACNSRLQETLFEIPLFISENTRLR